MSGALRLGFLGVGWIGRSRMAAMLATGHVGEVALVEPDERARAEALALAPHATMLPDYAALLEADLDGIVIATPSAAHASQSIAALERGRAVFCQKPLGRSEAEVSAVIAAARTADRLLDVDLSYRHTAAMRAIRPLIAEGALGPIHAVDLVFHNAYGPDKPWFYDRALAGGGCLVDLGVHLVDLALWALDWPDVTDVRGDLLARGAPATADDVEDYATATLRLATGVIVRIACSWRLQAGRAAEIRADFYGENGGAALRNVAGSFFDFTAERFAGTASELLSGPPDDWSGRAAANWVERLAHKRSFDPAAERLADSARVLDRIYASGLARD